ncbi:energy transducer TonB [Hyunsoonleella ulvae]|uniref:energy transducer TonB n=1 Tax=Hyunsoonleella ulvae TaxID=2799948 RepID=UPI00193A0654|nr:energy transducer TonB [Hyunsoonleella ulvae]
MKKPHRHDANLQKNSTLFFQVGLIVCLLTTLGLLEMRFETKPVYVAYDYEDPDDVFDMEAINYKPYVEPEQKQQIKKQEKATKKFINKIEKAKDDTDLPEDIVETPTKKTADLPLNPYAVDNIERPDIPDEIDFIVIENVPVYPGCEDKVGNKARKKCMSDAITRLVQRKFNGSDIASRYGLEGKQRISVQFLIDKTGKVTDIKTRAPHEKLEAEAKRVVNKIPDMKPGKQRDRPVGVRYTLPIMFIAQ